MKKTLVKLFVVMMIVLTVSESGFADIRDSLSARQNFRDDVGQNRLGRQNLLRRARQCRTNFDGDRQLAQRSSHDF